MTKTEMYMNAARKFSPYDRSVLPVLARDLRRWVDGQSRAIRELGPPKQLRCLAYVTLPRRAGELISCEFLGTGGRSYAITIASSGYNHLHGQTPHTASLNASLSLVALLSKAVGVPVTLHP